MAKIESGHADWRSSPVDMVALIQQAVLSTAGLFQHKGIAVSTALPAQVPLLDADEDRLTQVVVNLLSNAAKFTPADHGRVRVTLTAAPDGVTVSVSDNGPGVPEAQRTLVFEKFRQGGDAAHRPQGTGLGLPISRQIVEHFGGRMWVESAAEGGACFSFCLPWHIAPEPPEETP